MEASEIREKVTRYVKKKSKYVPGYLIKEFERTQALNYARKEVEMVGTAGVAINAGRIVPRLRTKARYFGMVIEVKISMDGTLFFSMTEMQASRATFKCHAGQNTLGVSGRNAVGWLLEFGIPGESRDRMIRQCLVPRKDKI